MFYLIHCLASFLSLSKMSQSYKCSARSANIPDKSQKLKKQNKQKRLAWFRYQLLFRVRESGEKINLGQMNELTNGIVKFILVKMFRFRKSRKLFDIMFMIQQRGSFVRRSCVISHFENDNWNMLDASWPTSYFTLYSMWAFYSQMISNMCFIDFQIIDNFIQWYFPI